MTNMSPDVDPWSQFFLCASNYYFFFNFSPQRMKLEKPPPAATPIEGQSCPVRPAGSRANSHFPRSDSKRVCFRHAHTRTQP